MVTHTPSPPPHSDLPVGNEEVQFLPNGEPVFQRPPDMDDILSRAVGKGAGGNLESKSLAHCLHSYQF